MLDPQIAAHIELVQAADKLSASAFVRGAPDRPLRWRFEATSRSRGGSSTVSQGGRIDEARSAPVGVLALTPGSDGTAVLSIYDGDTEVARDEVVFRAGEPLDITDKAD